jgi:5'-3' exonuclease
MVARTDHRAQVEIAYLDFLRHLSFLLGFRDKENWKKPTGSIGVTVWSMREYEADDGLASGARRFRDQVEQVRILTPDKDLGQCLWGDRVVQVDRPKGEPLQSELKLPEMPEEAKAKNQSFLRPFRHLS